MKKLAKKAGYKLLNSLIGAAIIVGLFFAIQRIITIVTPSTYYIRVYDIYALDSTVGKGVMLHFCRDSKRTFTPFSVRTFIESGNHVTGEYTFTPNIEKGDSCTSQIIPITKQPQVAGMYKIRTNYLFSVDGVTKEVSFTTNEYNYKGE